MATYTITVKNGIFTYKDYERHIAIKANINDIIIIKNNDDNDYNIESNKHTTSTVLKGQQQIKTTLSDSGDWNFYSPDSTDMGKISVDVIEKKKLQKQQQTNVFSFIKDIPSWVGIVGIVIVVLILIGLGIMVLWTIKTNKSNEIQQMYFEDQLPHNQVFGDT